MEFIIISVLTIGLTCYSWWAGYKLGERKGKEDMESQYRSYFDYRPKAVSSIDRHV